ncbi:NUDIX domain-containing protein [uncultured Shewanella sp.]|uniref:NUDIX domain-containing protein n=1 Tax=uncultured Shewanella sp. TaxID=173975 RepID=UPI00261A0163|nr:NUDIX domain-containing protein [uncultured Shewanella sp.]
MTLKETFNLADVKLMNKKVNYHGFFHVDELTFKHKLFSGGWSAEVKREVFERGNAVVVLAYDPSCDQVILVEQIRVPILTHMHESTVQSPWLLELAAGMIELNELPEEVARRELLEETGLDAIQLNKINHFYPSPGGCSERVELYLAIVDASKAGGIHGLASEHEDIRVHVISRINAYNKVISGEIVSAPTIIGLQWLMMNYSALEVVTESDTI